MRKLIRGSMVVLALGIGFLATSSLQAWTRVSDEVAAKVFGGACLICGYQPVDTCEFLCTGCGYPGTAKKFTSNGACITLDCCIHNLTTQQIICHQNPFCPTYTIIVCSL